MYHINFSTAQNHSERTALITLKAMQFLKNCGQFSITFANADTKCHSELSWYHDNFDTE